LIPWVSSVILRTELHQSASASCPLRVIFHRQDVTSPTDGQPPKADLPRPGARPTGAAVGGVSFGMSSHRLEPRIVVGAGPRLDTSPIRGASSGAG
jgi:hypothetical protein